MVRVTREMDIETPRVPNYLRCGKGQDDVVAVSELSESELTKVAEAWLEALLENARRMKEVGDDKR